MASFYDISEMCPFRFSKNCIMTASLRFPYSYSHFSSGLILRFVLILTIRSDHSAPTGFPSLWIQVLPRETAQMSSLLFPLLGLPESQDKPHRLSQASSTATPLQTNLHTSPAPPSPPPSLPPASAHTWDDNTPPHLHRKRSDLWNQRPGEGRGLEEGGQRHQLPVTR